MNKGIVVLAGIAVLLALPASGSALLVAWTTWHAPADGCNAPQLSNHHSFYFVPNDAAFSAYPAASLAPCRICTTSLSAMRYPS